MNILLIVCSLVLLRAVILFLARAISSWVVRGCIWSAIGLVLAVIGGSMVMGDPQFNNPNVNTLDARSSNGIVIFFIGLTVFMWPWIWRFVSVVWDSVRAAAQPVPSVQQINQILTNYYGRPATIEEVAAAQSIFAHNRNEAAAQAALGVGAFLLFTHRL